MRRKEQPAKRMGIEIDHADDKVEIISMQNKPPARRSNSRSPAAAAAGLVGLGPAVPPDSPCQRFQRPTAVVVARPRRADPPPLF